MAWRFTRVILVCFYVIILIPIALAEYQEFTPPDPVMAQMPAPTPVDGAEEISLQHFHRLTLFDEIAGTPLGPLDDGWDELWGRKVTLKEDFLLEEILRELENMVTIKTHVVQPGETLWDISKKYSIDVATLAGANHDIENIHRIHPGQELRILNMRGTLHKVKQGETLVAIAHSYKVDIDDILLYNGEIDDQSLQAGVELFIPGVKPLDFADRGGALDTFVWPVKGGWISSPFGMRWGRMHEGIDIAVNVGTPVAAAKSGWVSFSGWFGSYGMTVDIDHGSGVLTRYAHNSNLLVRSGQYVHQGQIIAYSGNTGSSTGPHLHFEVRQNNRAVNPLHYLPPR